MLHTPLKRLDSSFIAYRVRPRPRILQFGGGNFMRAFFDWKVDRINEAAGSDWGIVIIRSVANGQDELLRSQEGLFTVFERGLDTSGREISEPRIVCSVLGEFFAQTDWDAIRALARNPEIRVITSNTTEAGIDLDNWDTYDDRPPKSFPAKLTRVLHERWKFLRFKRNSGWQIIPCELVEDNGDLLAKLVERQATIWDLEPDFIDWLTSANTFYNTLVDRIVSGLPRGEEATLSNQLGYSDRFIVVAEPFHFLAVERRDGQPDPVIPFAKHDSGSVIAPDISNYRSTKVSILNGAHTAMCPLAMLAGIETVCEAVADPSFSRFLSLMLEQEIMPQLLVPPEDLAAYALAVRHRFANPHIRHRWQDVALNGPAKYRVRLLPHLLAQMEKSGRPPRFLVLSLAAWSAIDRAFSSHAPEQARLPGNEDVTALISDFLGDTSLWGQNLNQPMLHRAVAGDYRRVREAALSHNGILELLDSLTTANAAYD